MNILLRGARALVGRLHAYYSLTKPTIMLLVVITGAAGLVVEGSLIPTPWRFSLALLLLAMAGGSANAFNQAFERERDAVMERTRKRRVLPSHKIGATEAFIVAGLLGVASVVFYWMYFNPLASLLSAATILFYAIFYTLYLKPRTAQNIVIGGAAGAMAPVIGWAAGAGTIGIVPVLLFLIIFLWTPPHFWALALCLQEDYKKVGLPMMPLVVGEAGTWKRIFIYMLLTLAVSVAPLMFGVGALYGMAALGLGIVFYRKTITAMKAKSVKSSWGLFGYSIVYLLGLFIALIVDHGVRL